MISVIKQNDSANFANSDANSIQLPFGDIIYKILHSLKWLWSYRYGEKAVSLDGVNK